MASTAQTIYNYFLDKGFSKAGAAAAAANAQYESSFSTTASGDGGSAIGIFQWEGSRRTALQNFARQRGTSETDLQTQLDYAWHELTTNYSGVLKYMRNATNPSEAARVWDVGAGGVNSGTGFENSAGTTTGERQQSAGLIFNGGGAAYLAGFGGKSPKVTSSGGGGMSSSDAGMTAADYNAVDGLGNLLHQIPELRGILDNAVKTGMSEADFKDQIENSKWWKQNSSTARQFLVLRANDRATYDQQLLQAREQIRNRAGQLGVSLTRDQEITIARTGMFGGQLGDQDWVDGSLLGTVNAKKFTNPDQLDSLKGGLAATVAQLKQIQASYGQGDSPASAYVYAAQQILAGKTTIDTYTQHYKDVAKSMFPGLSSQIDGGLTVSDLASPYQQAMSNILEINPASVSLRDPLIRKALQGTGGVAAKGTTTPTSQPLWQFEQTLRADPRWQQTQNAKDTVSSALSTIGRDWGFLG